MWINRALNQAENTESAHVGTVTNVNGNNIDIASNMQLLNVPLVCGVNISSIPVQGQEVVVLPAKDDEYYCIGQPLISKDICEGETKISSSGGAYIWLKSNGDIILNGVTITKSGKIIGGAI